MPPLPTTSLRVLHRATLHYSTLPNPPKPTTLTPPTYLKTPPRPPKPLTPLLYIFPLTAFTLFLWQLQRLKQKQTLIEKLESSLYDDPILYDSKQIIGDECANRRIMVRGRYLHSKKMKVGPRSIETGIVGSDVVTPMVLEDG